MARSKWESPRPAPPGRRTGPRARRRERLNERQEKVLLRMFREGVDGFKGGLSSNSHISITGCSPATATRDLAKLVELGAMVRTGELKNARYFLKPE